MEKLPIETQEANWKPTFIDIEGAFDDFVPKFRNGKRVTDLVSNIPQGCLNADYYFSDDNVIVELKCLSADPTDTDKYINRLVSAFTKCGYSGSDLMGHTFRGEPLPDDVSKRMFNFMKRPIVKALEKANKQIRATKSLVKNDAARGIVLIANDNNFGLNPARAISILSTAALNLCDSHTDGIIYITPNVFHNCGDDIARHFWVPTYKPGMETLADDFVDDFGRAWFDEMEILTGPSIDRWEGPFMPKNMWTGWPDKGG